MSPQTALIIGTAMGLSGTIVNTIAQFVTTKRAKQSEERKHFRALVIGSAIETWKHQSRRSVGAVNLEAHIIRMMKFSELFIDQKSDFDEATIDQKLSEMNAATRMFIACSEK